MLDTAIRESHRVGSRSISVAISIFSSVEICFGVVISNSISICVGRRFIRVSWLMVSWASMDYRSMVSRGCMDNRSMVYGCRMVD